MGLSQNKTKGGYMSKIQEDNQSRRKFLKTAGVGGVVVAIGSLSLNSCSGERTQKEVIKGKSKKQEILYRGDTQYWQSYFSVAK